MRRGGWIAAACLLCAVAWTTLPADGSQQAPAVEGLLSSSSVRPLVLLANEDYPPLSYVENGVVTGIDVDVARALSRLIGRGIRIEVTPWGDAQQRLLHGDADGLLSMSVTQERRALYDFTEPTIERELGIFVRAGDPSIRTILDISDRRVAVTAAGLPRRLIEASTTANLVTVGHHHDAFAMLAAGTVDAVAADQWVGAYTIQQQGLHNIVRAGEPFATLGGAIAIPKGHEALVNDLNQAIRAIKTDGTLDSILKRWRPKEIVFVTRERMNWILGFAGAMFVVVAVAGLNAIRKQIRAQARQREAEQRIRLLAQALQSASDCVVITDTADHVVYVNEAFLRTYEFDEAELIGKHIDVVRPGNTPPDLADAIRTDTFRGDGWRGVIGNRTKSGRTFPVSLATSTVKDEQGRTIAAVGVARDRSHEEAAEAALRASEEKYRQVVESARDVIFTVDPDGYCNSMNGAGYALTGFGDTPHGVHLSHLVAPDQAAMAVELLRRVLAGEAVPQFEIAVLSRVGKRLIFELDVHPIRVGTAIVGAQGIARDVTARKELEAQLLQAQKMEAVGRLAGGVAHDFNNVLTVIMACAELAAMEIDRDSPAFPDLEQIQHAAASAASLTRQLLIFSRKSVVVPTILDLNESVRRLERMLRRLVGDDIELVLRLASNAGHVEADQTQLEQVVLNLFVNARDAMPSGGTLTIETGVVDVHEPFRALHGLPLVGPLTTLTITDTGFGMSPEIKAQIFDPFFTTKDESKGTGLGLATVDAIVRQARGCVTVESTPGKGAAFTIYLPLISSPRAASASDTGADSGRADGTILLVEDDAAVRTVAARALRERGYTVLTARHAEDALQVFEMHAGGIDLLLTDVVMPGPGGRALAAEMRRTDPHLRVLFTSGYSDQPALDPEIAIDADAFLQKPYSVDVLVRRVGQILGRRFSSDRTAHPVRKGIA